MNKLMLKTGFFYFFIFLSSTIIFNSCSNDDIIIQYSITVQNSPEDSGGVSPSSGMYVEGKTISLLATPSADYSFKNWSGDASGTSNPTTVVMNSDKSITAVFELKDTDSDGVTDDIDACSETPEGEIVDDTGCSVKTYVPDDNFEQALIDYGYDDVLDDYVLTQNIEDVLELILPEKNISDLTGIEDFKNLSTLYVYHNNLAKIDVSKNTNLISLWVFDNELESLDVSNNLNLYDLYAELNNITEIDLGSNLNLVSFAISGNPLTDIDISNNSKLARLWVTNTLLSSLNVENNPYLTYLEMDNNSTSFYQHSITSINLTNNPELIILKTNNAELGVLDLSNNSKLEHLGVRNTGLSSLDVSHMNNLNKLFAELNQISCIKVNETQLNNIPSEWYKDASTSYSLDCSVSQSNFPFDGLIAFYPFNGNANDESSNENNGSVSGSILTSDRFGNINSAYNFNGSSNYISLPQPFFNGSVSVPALTFSSWFNVSSIPTKDVFISAHEGYWRSKYVFLSSDGSVHFGRTQPSPQAYIDINSGPSAYSINAWNHLLVTFNAGVLTMYINGVKVSTKTIPYTTLDYSLVAAGNSTGTNFIGAQYAVSPGIQGYFTGKIDDIAIWDRALTEQEILNLYNLSN